MVTGFGIIDYFVVILISVFTIISLRRHPRRLLLWLPLFLTIDFFIPLGTQLTPSRIVPLILGFWLIFKWPLLTKRAENLLILLSILVVSLSLIYSLLINDSGIRPIFRSLHYLNLVFIFIFVIRVTEDESDLKVLLWGLVLAGAVHSCYGLYQLFASFVGLPFRGIVYDNLGQGVARYVSGTLRINGLADEPKRLGYILFSSMIACVYFAKVVKKIWQSVLLWLLSIICFSVSILTFSGSYLSTVGIATLLILLFSTRLTRPLVTILIILLLTYFFYPKPFIQYGDSLSNFIGARIIEIERGLDTQKVYRQEFFANDYLDRNPDVYLIGVGIGRYNKVLYESYGLGAGFENDNISPLNSQYYEILFDFGLVGIFIFYGALIILIFKLGKRNMFAFTFWAILIFLTIQSLTIQNLQLTVFVAAGGVAFQRYRKYQNIIMGRKIETPVGYGNSMI